MSGTEPLEAKDEPMTYTENTKSYVVIPNGDETEAFALDTVTEIQVAQQAMLDAELSELPIYVGHPDCPDSYCSDRVLLADDTAVNSAYEVVHAE